MSMDTAIDALMIVSINGALSIRWARGESAGLGLGMIHAGVRWKVVTDAAVRATAGAIWIPLEPVPITATRLPA
ncbi:Uncharacterised protein [Mycobacteroides abscessus subsp. abscessus]|nr:Uncharacterised protein [Mycobacteroides abscessus subsp. abscessus]